MRIKTIKALIPFFIACLLAYLVGAFYSVSFDISTWTHECRGVIAFCGVFSGTIGLIAMVVSLNPQTQQLKKK